MDRLQQEHAVAALVATALAATGDWVTMQDLRQQARGLASNDRLDLVLRSALRAADPEPGYVRRDGRTWRAYRIRGPIPARCAA